MKHINSQKWMLSALLIAALGSQYYFSTPSNEMSSIELSSRSVAQAASDDASDLAAGSSGDSTASASSGDTSAARGASGDASAARASSGDSSAARGASGDASAASATSSDETEATADSAARTCVNCVGVIIPREQVADVLAFLNTLSAPTSTDGSASRNSVERDRRDDDAPPEDETGAERRARLASERREAEAERRLQNESDFRERIARLTETCNEDARCIANGFTTTLIGFSAGRKQLAPAFVQQVYRENIEGPLRNAILSGDPNVSAAVIAELINRDMPSIYRTSMNTTITATIQTASTERATSINNNFRLANQLANQPNSAAQSVQLMQQAMSDQALFQRDANIYVATLSNSMQATGDTAGLRQLQETFIPALHTLVAGLGSTTPTGTTGSDATRGVVRGGDAPPLATTGGAPGATITTTPTPGTAVFGAPGTGTRGGRGSY